MQGNIKAIRNELDKIDGFFAFLRHGKSVRVQILGGLAQIERLLAQLDVLEKSNKDKDGKISKLNLDVQNLTKQITDFSAQISQKTIDYEALSMNYANLRASFDALNQALSQANLNLKAKDDENMGLKSKLTKFEKEKQNLNEQISLQNSKLIAKDDEISSLKATIKESENMRKAFKRLEHENEDLQDENNKIKLQNDLVAFILSAKIQDEGAMKFNEVFKGEWLDFANADGTLANEAQITMMLEGLQKELEMMAGAPEIFNKNIVAVGGGFSAGKSKFISSFISSGLKLPTSIEPTTAIPTYVMSGESERVLGFGRDGGVVNLNQLGDNFHLTLSHQFLDGLGFNLKDILPFLVISTKHDYENICFIDTPGYNPSGTKASADVNTAQEFLKDANSFIWVVDCTKGTLPSDDLQFLQRLNLENKKLYFVVNKADLKPKSDLKAIVENIVSVLNDAGIKFEGIQTYCSSEKIENILCVGKNLNDFLSECNVPGERYNEFFAKLKFIYLSYKIAIEDSIKYKDTMRSVLNNISLDMLEVGADNMESSAHIGVNGLKKECNTDLEKRNLISLKKAMNGLIEATEMTFGVKNTLDFDKVDAKTCKIITEANSNSKELKVENNKKAEQVDNNKKVEQYKSYYNNLFGLLDGR